MKFSRRAALAAAIGAATIWSSSSVHAVDPILITRPDAFQTLVNPDCSHCVDEAKRRSGELKADDRVLAWTRGKYQGGAIPIRFFLAPYRVISDTYGVFVYDPEAGFARGYAPSLEFTFHGWRNGVLVIKHKDGTLFSALSGKAFAGPRQGQRLKPVATLTSDWGPWTKRYPGTVAYHMFEKYQPVELVDKEHPDSVASRLPVDARLPAKEEVLGVVVGETAKAYRVADLQAADGLVRDSVGGTTIVALWDKTTRTAAAYAYELEPVDGKPVKFISLLPSPDGEVPFLEASGSQFDVAGRGVSGALKDRTMRWVDSVQCRWFAWAAEYPQTVLWQPPATEKRKQSSTKKPTTKTAVLVAPRDVTPAAATAWKQDGINGLVVELNERHAPDDFTRELPRSPRPTDWNCDTRLKWRETRQWPTNIRAGWRRWDAPGLAATISRQPLAGEGGSRQSLPLDADRLSRSVSRRTWRASNVC